MRGHFFRALQFGPRRILLAGFGGLLVLMVAAGAGTLLFLRTLRATEAATRQHYLSRNRALEQIRSGIYLSGMFARDCLLAPNEEAAEAQRSRLQRVRLETDAALDAYARSLGAQETEPFVSLRAEIRVYWKVLDLMLDLTGRNKAQRGSPFFYRELIERRTAMLQITDRIAAIHEKELRARDQQLAATLDRFRARALVILAVTLCLGVVLAGVSIRGMLRLEGEARQRKAELQELSARLVKAQEEERRAISRELHDEVAQSLSAVLVESSNLAAVIPRSCTGAHRHVESIRRLVDGAIQAVRNMALLLRPSMLDDFGLLPALEWQGREVEKRTGLRVEVDADEAAAELPEDHKTCIYRVTQEALHNCARWARARSVKVAVRQQPQKVVLTIRDDGCGFASSRVRGLGLLGIAERVSHLGGVFHIESQPGAGTLLSIELPCPEVRRQPSNGDGAGIHV